MLINSHCVEDEILPRTAFHRRGCLQVCAGILALASMMNVALGGEPALKLGVFTDTHIGSGYTRDASHLDGALRLFKANRVDAIVNVGDVCDRHEKKLYDLYAAEEQKFFPSDGWNPKRYFVYAWHDAYLWKGHAREDAMKDQVPAYADMRTYLKADNAPIDATELNGYPILFFYEFMPWETCGYEEAVIRAERQYPGKPIFIFDHSPILNTVAETHPGERADRCAKRREILDRHPRAIHISGHKHGTLRDERNIWQGTFTAISAGCMQVLSGMSCEDGKPIHAREASILEVYPDHIVLRRYDTTDGSEIGADRRWTFPLPFDPKTAPYTDERRRATEPIAAFPSSATIDCAPATGKRAGNLTVSFADVGAAFYRIEIAETKADGTQETFFRRNLQGGWRLRPEVRTARIACEVPSALFEPGETYSLKVTPYNFAHVPGAAIRCDVPSPTAPCAEVVRLVWDNRTPMDGKIPLTVGRRTAGYAVRDGYFSAGSRIVGRYLLPTNIVCGVKGRKYRIVADARVKTQPGEHYQMTIAGFENPDYQGMTARQCIEGGNGNLTRVVCDFTADGRFPSFCLYAFLDGKGASGIRFDRIRVYEMLPEAKHDCGGVSFNFQAISERNNAGMFDGVNLLTNVWKGVYVENVPRPQVVKLPDAEGGWYRVSCRTKVRSTNSMDSAVMVRLGTANPEFVESPERHGRWVWCPFAKRDDAYFPATTRFEVRPGETHAHVSLWNRRQFVDIRDLTLFKERPVADAAPLSIGVQITDFLDGRFALAAGQTVAMAFNIVPQRPGKWDARKLDVRFELPDGVKLVDTTRAILIAGFSHWNSTYALLEATGPVGVAGTGRIVATYDDGKQKFDFASKPIRFEIVPTIKVPVPKHYRNGAFTVRSFDFRQLASCDRYAASLADYGCRWVIPGMADSYPALAAWRKYGMWVTPYSNNCSNGYKIGDRNVPPDVQYVFAGTNPHIRSIPPPNDRLCPLAVIDRSEYYRTKVEPLLARTLAGTDGMWSNWEPYMFEGVGCCCDRCRRAFAAYVGKPEVEIAAGWPTNVLRGGIWAKAAGRFRSICHGKLVKTIAESVRKATNGGPVGFMPAVHFEQLMENWPKRLPMPEAQEFDYAGSLKWIQPWGPYVPWFTDKLYCRERGKYVNHCLVAPAVRRGVERDYPLPSRPKLLAGPQGTCDGWLTQPENFKMAFDAYFFNRYDGCAPWMFPVGADARYWRAFADATALAAKYEDIVRAGTDVTAKTKVETVPEYAATIRLPTRRLPEVKDVSHLFVFAYEQEAKRIAAVFNCWQDGEAFFTLKAADLKPGTYEIVSDDGVVWTKGEGADAEPWSAAELAKGAFLSVGAARTRVFEIRPVGSTGPTAATSYRSAERVRTDYESRRAVLAKAAARDAAEAKAHSGVPTRDD